MAAFVTIGSPEDKRVRLFDAALVRVGLGPAKLVSYEQLLFEPGSLASELTPGTVVRIDSPGTSVASDRALLLAGAADGGLGETDVEELLSERGRLLPSRQWFLGFRMALHRIAGELATEPRARVTALPDEIEVLFDKKLCRERLSGANLPIPEALPEPESYEDLRHQMTVARVSRVFVKPRHGSSASGVLALEAGGGRVQLHTTIEVVSDPKGERLFNSKRVRRYRDERVVARLVEALVPQGVVVERWLPKLVVGDRACDLRVVTIAGTPSHMVARMSRGPITNLHLDSARGPIAALRKQIPADAWERAMQTAHRTAALFPGCLHLGLDMLISPGLRSHAVAEVNAFGDLLPGLEVRGRDTYGAELAALLEAA